MSAQTIFEQLRRAGCTATGALALMGNWQEESNLESCRLQGDFTSDRWKSKDYANKVNSGVISDEVFARDSKGWGLAQWTFWSRKQGLLSYCKRNGKSVADEETQVKYAIAEMKTSPEYAAVWKTVTTATENDLYSAVDLICRRYEQPAVNNVNVRYQYALELKSLLQGKAVEQIDNGVERFWPPRMICNGMNGADVSVLQALLTAHGYIVPITGVFSDSTEKAVRKYQADNDLNVDGVAGTGQTWPSLLKI